MEHLSEYQRGCRETQAAESSRTDATCLDNTQVRLAFTGEHSRRLGGHIRLVNTQAYLLTKNYFKWNPNDKLWNRKAVMITRPDIMRPRPRCPRTNIPAENGNLLQRKASGLNTDVYENSLFLQTEYNSGVLNDNADRTEKVQSES